MSEKLQVIIIVLLAGCVGIVSAYYLNKYAEKKCADKGGELGSRGTCFKPGVIIH